MSVEIAELGNETSPLTDEEKAQIRLGREIVEKAYTGGLFNESGTSKIEGGKFLVRLVQGTRPTTLLLVMAGYFPEQHTISIDQLRTKPNDLVLNITSSNEAAIRIMREGGQLTFIPESGLVDPVNLGISLFKDRGLRQSVKSTGPVGVVSIADATHSLNNAAFAGDPIQLAIAQIGLVGRSIEKPGVNFVGLVAVA